MSSIGTGYDLSFTTFSSDGRVFQIEYAAKATTTMGVEKLISSKMMLPGSNRGIHAVHRHSGMFTIAGFAADGRQIVTRAKSKATNYEKVYGEPIPVKELAECVASYVHLCTLYWWPVEIENLKLSELMCREGVIEVAKIIYGVHDEAKDKAFELEMSWVCEESNRQHQKVNFP
ncbi:Proteasome endopeptidase complex protein [Dioscorea alata]|uniref:Proteasome endopeptidase complex protein n=1 Tax=Dioscorea alata TaxID=55571 RepID=A0ACB7VX29_DIOAL|nr:Proteasome endopeptidase complex protein [Dioscorea alata]